MSCTRLERSAWMFCLMVLGLITAAHAVDPDPTGVNKSRFISFDPNQQEALTSIRIWLVSLHHVDPPYNVGPSTPFTLFESQSVWVGPPANYIESAGSPVPFNASKTQCTPHYQDWSTVGLLHVTGAHIVPSSIYEVEQLSGVCQGQEETCTEVSARLEIRTTRWGDLVDSFNPPAITTQPDIAEIKELRDKFRNVPGAPIKARAYLASTSAFGEFSTEELSRDMGFAHIAAVVDGFRGKGYPYRMGECVSAPRYCEGHPNSTCNSNADCEVEQWGPCVRPACSTDAECGANGPCNLYCPD